MKFEYATVPLLSHATKQILDTWGSDGWELVTVIPAPGGEQLVAYMKREVKQKWKLMSALSWPKKV